MFVPGTFSLLSVSAAAILFGLVTFEQPPRGVPGNALPRLGVRAAAATTSSVRERDQQTGVVSLLPEHAMRSIAFLSMSCDAARAKPSRRLARMFVAISGSSGTARSA
jgi:hypothetical protein